MILFDFIKVISVVHHHPKGLFEPFAGVVCAQVNPFEYCSIVEMKLGNRIAAHAFIRGGLGKIGRTQARQSVLMRC